MNIYISNLSFDVTDKDLNELFESFGTVSSAKVITDRFSGKSRGFGFVEMPDNAEAQKAIDELHQSEHFGKSLTVNEARPREEKPRSNNFRQFGGNGGGQRRGGFNQDRRKTNRW